MPTLLGSLVALGFATTFAITPRFAQAAPADLRATPDDARRFPLTVEGRALPLVLSGDSAGTSAHEPIARAAADLATDLARVLDTAPGEIVTLPSGAPSAVGSTPPPLPLPAPACILVGRLGDGGLIDQLVATDRLSAATGLAGTWESFLVQVVELPTPLPELPGVKRALVVAGSDVRGTIYALYEISEAIGVSPWHWWADVPVARDPTVALRVGPHRKGPPPVKYRGIFLNDEDWGLQPWAAKTFEPAHGDIGPRTYAALFELLLRLRANTFWPAMHACTRPFNMTAGLGDLAQSYGVIHGTSHAEPMLCNNVGEWAPRPPENFNYVTHRNAVLNYWEDRLVTHGRFENIYTLGMRGIHDSGMQGGGTRAEQIARLERIFADQRFLLEDRINPDVTRVPQVFCAYKEVLDLYRGGLRVPDDVTLVWPDDNFGYIRTFPSPAEAARPGGNGIYYHVSYLGRPLSYLWLSTTPPALIWQQMTQAHDHGARQLWIVNVGDLKPAEIATEFFLQLAWDLNRWRTADAQPRFLEAWAIREFGAEHAAVIARVLEEFYRLNFQRRPEHLQWWLPRVDPQPRLSDLTTAEVDQRLAAFAHLTAAVDALAAALPRETQAAFYQLIAYPVRGAALANERCFALETHQRLQATDPAGALEGLRRAHAAHAGLLRETRFFNEELSGGKWRFFMTLEPADAQWAGMRIAAPVLPPLPPGEEPRETYLGPRFSVEAENDRAHLLAGAAPGRADLLAGFRAPTESSLASAPVSVIERDGVLVFEAEHVSAFVPAPSGATWTVVPGLGRTGPGALLLTPTTSPSFAPAFATGTTAASPDVSARVPHATYSLEIAMAGEFTLTAWLLPTHPVIAGTGLRFAVSVDDAPPQLVTLPDADGGATWSQAVLANTRLATATLTIPTSGRHTLRLYAIDPGVIVDKLALSRGPLPPSYLGPAPSNP